jgi:hypothetical protein
MANILKVISLVVIGLSVAVFLVSPMVGVSVFLGAVAGLALANIVD